MLQSIKQWLKEFLWYYKDMVGLPFTCFGHPKYLDEEIVRLLKLCGCHMVWLGIQNANENLRKHILNRYETNDEILSACKLIKKHGLKLMIDHIFGVPEEQEEDMVYSYDFYKRLKPDVVNCYEMLYFPRTKINEYGKGKSHYQNQAGDFYKRYSKAFCSLPLMVN